jgi:hypothetical protein
MLRFGADQTGNAVVEFDCIKHHGVDYISFASFESFALDIDCHRLWRLFMENND